MSSQTDPPQQGGHTFVPTFTASSPGGSPTSAQGTGDSSANATLYLYTFLATLVLLLAVSSAIVIRSLILRRRHQRLVEEAIRTGTWLPHHLDPGRKRRDVGQKPKLWEAWLNHDGDDGESEASEKRKWGDIMPVYAAYVHPPAPSHQGSTVSPTENSAELGMRPPRFILPFARRRSPSLTQPTTTVSLVDDQAPAVQSPSLAVLPSSAVRVAVLIAMPTPSQKQHGDECGPPVIEIGVVEADMKDGETETTNRHYS